MFQSNVPILPIFNTVKRTIHRTLFKISLKLKIEIKWDQHPLKTEINMFVLNTKPLLTDTWELRYIQNDYGKNAFLLDFCRRNSKKHAETINCLSNISASKNRSELVLYSKRTYLYQFLEDTGPIWFPFLVLEKFLKVLGGWYFLQFKNWVILGRRT